MAVNQSERREKLKEISFNEQGLIPAIVQDVQSKAVLMMAYMNEEAVLKTLETGETWFWSRSRNELWHKGATSGNVQYVRDIRLDCDGDTLLVLVQPAGPACHRGTYTCFDPLDVKIEQRETEQGTCDDIEYGAHRAQPSLDYGVLSQLIETIAAREAERPEGAYTTYLFEKGLDKILKKVGEESAEVIIAAKNRDAEELSNEGADLLYHLLVLFREQNVSLSQVLDVLSARHTR